MQIMILLLCAVALTHEGCDIGAIKKRVWKTTPKINYCSLVFCCPLHVVLEKVDLHRVYSFNNSTRLFALPIISTPLPQSSDLPVLISTGS